jgi:hypothetical protein
MGNIADIRQDTLCPYLILLNVFEFLIQALNLISTLDCKILLRSICPLAKELCSVDTVNPAAKNNGAAVWYRRYGDAKQILVVHSSIRV